MLFEIMQHQFARMDFLQAVVEAHDHMLGNSKISTRIFLRRSRSLSHFFQNRADPPHPSPVIWSWGAAHQPAN
jgi:hypothetical protein